MPRYPTRPSRRSSTKTAATIRKPSSIATSSPVYKTLAAQIAACGLPTTYDRSTGAGRELDAMSLTAWIERFVPGGLRSRLGKFILIQYVAEYGIEPERQSSPQHDLLARGVSPTTIR